MQRVLVQVKNPPNFYRLSGWEMTAVKVIRRTTKPEDPEVVEINKLRDEWGARRQVDAGVLAGECCVPGCRTMPFVSLKTNIGRKALCLRHFEKLNVETV